MPDPRTAGSLYVRDGVATLIAEEYLRSATQCEGGPGSQEEVTTEELGGPFLMVDGGSQWGTSKEEGEPDEALSSSSFTEA